jgi:hypothetical protein
VRFEGGDAAIVNIVLRRGTNLGLSGSLSANSSTRGTNGGSGQIAYQRGRLTLFGGGSGNLMAHDNTSREVRRNLRATPITILDTKRRSENSNFHGSGDLTAEVTLGAKETLWGVGQLYTGVWGCETVTRLSLMDAEQAPIRVFDRSRRQQLGLLLGGPGAGLPADRGGAAPRAVAGGAAQRVR